MNAVVWVQMDNRINEVDRNFKVVLEYIRDNTKALKFLFVNGKGGWSRVKPLSEAKPQYARSLADTWKAENEKYYQFTYQDPWVSVSQDDFIGTETNYLNRATFLAGLTALCDGNDSISCVGEGGMSVPRMSTIIDRQKALFLSPENAWKSFRDKLDSEISSLSGTVEWRKEHIRKMEASSIGMAIGSLAFSPGFGALFSASNVGLAIGNLSNRQILKDEEKRLGEKVREKTAGEPPLKEKVKDAAKKWSSMARFLRVEHGIDPSLLSE